jgi:UDP-N-acetylmuramoylalanine--D-glutamate ligase
MIIKKDLRDKLTNVDELREKRILILGLGREGMSTFDFLRRRFPGKPLGLADRLHLSQLDGHTREVIAADGNVNLFLGNDYLESIGNHDIIFKTPGIPPFTPEIVTARDLGKICSNTALFFENCPGTIVGITGTKGKSTTASLIHAVLREGGVDARLTGNIGIPPLSSLNTAAPTTVFVAELSSHQLMDLHSSPQIAVILNVFREHLDYYQSLEAYIEAKQAIVMFQTENDNVIFNGSSRIVREMANTSRARKTPFELSPMEGRGCFLQGGFLVFQAAGHRQRVIPTGAIPLKGAFNLQNVMPAIAVGKIFGIANEPIAAAIRGFRPLEHRLEHVKTYNGISFYNDSLATAPEATIAAINAFPKKRLILLVGGFDRGQNFVQLAQMILRRNVKTLILFPTTGERLWDEIVDRASGKIEPPKHVFVTDMGEAVTEAYKSAESGEVVLLSPAGASFVGFKDYRDRGDQFKAEVEKLVG